MELQARGDVLLLVHRNDLVANFASETDLPVPQVLALIPFFYRGGGLTNSRLARVAYEENRERNRILRVVAPRAKSESKKQ
ncbi:MAG: hypothetical protein ACLQL2_10745 [Methylovirgula sp.]